MSRICRRLPALLLCAALFCGAVPGCCRHDESLPAASSLPAQATPEFVKTELYFGLSKPGGAVTEDEWNRFVDQHITPAFKEGLTIVDARGQWQNASGAIIHEGSKLVILIHKPDREKNDAITAIIAEYKKLFQQESVLRVTTAAAVEF